MIKITAGPKGFRKRFSQGPWSRGGSAGLVSLMGGQALAAGEKKGNYLVAITHGGNDPNPDILGLLMALTAADKGFGEVQVWFTLDGSDLANKTKVERIDSPIFKKFGNASDLMKKLKDKGATFGVCPPCADLANSCCFLWSRSR